MLGKKRLILVGIIVSRGALAESKHQFDGVVELGVEQDSTVIVDEIDSIDTTTNNANLMRLNLNYDYQLNPDNKFALAATHIRKDFQQSDQFNSYLQIYSANYSHDFSRYSLGVRNQLIRSDLNSADFLDMEQYAPYVSFFLSKQWFVNLSYSFADKTIKTNRARSARSQDLMLDTYRFFSGINHYLLFSYRSREESAQDSVFNFSSVQFRVSWLKKLTLWGLPHKLRVSGRFQRRHFNDEVNPIIDAFRIDYLRQWQIEWETQVTDAWVLTATLRQSQQDSNFSVARYDQDTHNLTLQYHF